MTGDNLQQEQGLNSLREQLLVFILDELANRVGTAPVAQLPKALADAIDAEVGRAFERRLLSANLPDPAVFRDELFAEAGLGARDQMTRDRQYDAVANRLAIVATGIERLLAERGIDFDPTREATQEELAALDIERKAHPETLAGGLDRSAVNADLEGNLSTSGWLSYLREWRMWIVGFIVVAAVVFCTVWWLQSGSQSNGVLPGSAEPGLVTLPTEDEPVVESTDGQGAGVTDADALGTDGITATGAAPTPSEPESAPEGQTKAKGR